MTKHNERAEDVQAAGAGEEAARERRGPRTRVIAEAVVGAIPAEGETGAAAPADITRRPRRRVVSEAVVAAIPAEGEAERGGGADDGAGA